MASRLHWLDELRLRETQEWTRDDPDSSDWRPSFHLDAALKIPEICGALKALQHLGRVRASRGERVSTGMRCEPHLPVRDQCLEADMDGWRMSLHRAGLAWWVQMTDQLNLNGDVLGL